MSTVFHGMQPQNVLQKFWDVSQVYCRDSGHCENISRFMAEFGENLGLETVMDSTGNVIIKKPATPGYEHVPAVMLASHMDMICLKTGVSYKELQDGMAKSCTRAIVPIMILLCVGGLVGTWNASGTVPIIISLGVRFVTPQFFLVTAFLLCVVCSLVTGTSWGTCGTAGLALAGVGLSLGINPLLTAGAVCSGAFFGDTISPPLGRPKPLLCGYGG